MLSVDTALVDGNTKFSETVLPAVADFAQKETPSKAVMSMQ
jgi:hypothetical protein